MQRRTKGFKRPKDERLKRLSKRERIKQRRGAYTPDPNHPRCPVTGKLRFSSLTAAENVLREIMLRGSYKQRAHRSYQCEFCDGFHHTSIARRYN